MADVQSKANGFQQKQDALAEKSGLAVVLVDEKSPVSASQNNSICQVFQASSPAFAAACGEFCGRAFEFANAAGKEINYRCHAGLTCVAVPLESKKTVAIIGRAFLSSADYRGLTERVRTGDLRDWAEKNWSENLLFSNSLSDLEQLAAKIQLLKDESSTGENEKAQPSPREISDEEINHLIEKQKDSAPIERFVEKQTEKNSEPSAPSAEKPIDLPAVNNRNLDSLIAELNKSTAEPQIVVPQEEKPSIVNENSGEVQSLLSSIFHQSFKDACQQIMQFLADKYGFSGLAWLERNEKRLETSSVVGNFKTPQMQIGLEVTDSRLLKVIEQETSLRLQAKLSKTEPTEVQVIELFPLAFGSEIRDALVVGEKLASDEMRREIARFCRQISVPFEVLRLREILKQREAKTEALQKQAEEFEIMAITDGLTGLLNRRYLDARLSEELKRSQRHGYSMGFVMIDVDNFGKFNKDFGYQVGDEVLRETSRVMKATLRDADVAARYGGEEFCILLPQTTVGEAFAIAQRIRQRIEKTPFSQRQITVSIGVAAFSEKYSMNSTPEKLIEAADSALRQAKQNGKNNVQING